MTIMINPTDELDWVDWVDDVNDISQIGMQFELIGVLTIILVCCLIIKFIIKKGLNLE